MNKQVIYSYLRSFLATCLAAVFAVGKMPHEFTSTDWTNVGNAIWIAIIPVAIRVINPKDELTLRK